MLAYTPTASSADAWTPVMAGQSLAIPSTNVRPQNGSQPWTAMAAVDSLRWIRVTIKGRVHIDATAEYAAKYCAKPEDYSSGRCAYYVGKDVGPRGATASDPNRPPLQVFAQIRDPRTGDITGIGLQWVDDWTAVGTVRARGVVEVARRGYDATTNCEYDGCIPLFAFTSYQTVQVDTAATPKLHLDCPAQVTRGTRLDCTAQVRPVAAMTIRGWSFTDDQGHVIPGPQAASSWGGTMAVGGSMKVDAVVAGALQSSTALVMVTPRNWTGKIQYPGEPPLERRGAPDFRYPPVDPANPAPNQHGAFGWFYGSLPQAIYGVATGPNSGWLYLDDVSSPPLRG